MVKTFQVLYSDFLKCTEHSHHVQSTLLCNSTPELLVLYNSNLILIDQLSSLWQLPSYTLLFHEIGIHTCSFQVHQLHKVYVYYGNINFPKREEDFLYLFCASYYS
jgi:hypothetical protein